MEPDKNTSENIFAMFCGAIDQISAQRIMNGIDVATQSGKKTHVHLLLQSTGGTIGDGICLHNYFKTCPIDLTVYNMGQIASVAVIAYLAARTRVANKHATFMIHASTAPAIPMNPDTLKSVQNTLRIDDERVQAILKEHIKISDDQWSNLRHHELWFTAGDAIKSGIATTIGDFAPPSGTPIYTF
jgi:ATP-dependent Clp protease, protease subunit